MPSVFGETVTFNLKGLTEAQKEKLGELLCKGVNVEPATLLVAKQQMWRAILRRAHDVERQEKQEAANATVTETPFPEAP